MKSIIIIDDDAAIRDAYELVFKEEGFEVTSYSNGIPVLKNEFTEPDIFLIDKQLYGANGVDLCRYIKTRDNKSKQTPVIIFSASPHSAAFAHEAGADAFLEKPFSNKVLVDLVKQILT